jgi:ketosteroid isomerase-like protein
VSQENVEIVRELWDAYLRGDYAAVFSALDPEIEFRPPPEFPDFQIYHGHEGIRRAFSSWLGTWEEHRSEVPEYIDAGDQVVATNHQWGKVKGTGTEVENTAYNVLTLRAGKVIRYEMFFERRAAFEAAGLSEDAHTSS